MQPVPEFRRAITTALVPIDLRNVPPDWLAGPLPNSWRSAAGKPVDGTTAGRTSYINPGIEDILYRRSGRTLLRWHKMTMEVAPTGRSVVEALEILSLPFRPPFPTGLLFMHLRLDETLDPIELQRSINHLTNHNPHHVSGSRQWLASLVDPWATINSRHRRSQHVTLLTRATPDWPPLGLGDDPSTRTSRWLFSLSTSGRYRPDPDAITSKALESTESSQIWMSDNLRGVVSRDGFAMVGLKDDDGGAKGKFGFDYDGAEFFARGLYADVLALSIIQRIALDALDYDLAQRYPHKPTPEGLLTLENELSSFRTRIWRQDFAPQGSHDEVLAGLQDVQRLASRESDLSRNISELSARTSRIEQNTIATLLRLLTFVGAFWGLAWALLSDLKVSWRGWALAATFSALAILVARHPGLRPALGIATRVRRRDEQVHLDLGREA